MNYSTAVMLINSNIRAIKCIYLPETDDQICQRVRDTGVKPAKGQARYTFKTLDSDIKKGDYVVVPTSTRHGMTVVLVDEVDVEVDFDSETVIAWAVSRVDLADSKIIATEEVKWIDALKASEKRRKREEIKKNLLDMYKDDGIEKLAIASMGASAHDTVLHAATLARTTDGWSIENVSQYYKKGNGSDAIRGFAGLFSEQAVAA